MVFYKKISLSCLTILTLTCCATASELSKFEFPEIKESPAVSNGQATIASYNNRLMATGHMRDGERHGRWEFFEVSGNKQELIADGLYAMGQRTGQWTFYRDGKISKRLTYINDTIEGPVTIFQENGIPELTYSLRSGEKNGKFQEYYSNGNPKEICWYKDGKKHGQTNLYYENGQRKAIGNYNENIKKGTWRYYNERGALQAVGEYANGERTGKWKLFDNDGRLAEEKEY